MKKLMVVLATAAAAFGLRAAATFEAGSNFEGESPFTGWTGGQVVDGKHNFSSDRPDKFVKDQVEEKALKVTTDSPVTFAFNGGTAKQIGTGLYFDGIVDLTVFDKDDAPAAVDGTKLAVYLMSTNEEGTINKLYVRANDGNGTAKDYLCEVPGQSSIEAGWHRLTIKTIENVKKGATLPGFVVYVDHVAAVSDEAQDAIAVDVVELNAYKFYQDKALFTSLGTDVNSLTAVDFKGQGNIGEFVVTDDTPHSPSEFAQDEGAYVLSWPVAKVASITVDGTTYTTTAYPNGKVTIIAGAPVAPTTINVTWTAMPGYISSSKTISVSGGAATLADTDVKSAAAEVTIGGTTTPYELLTGDNSALAAVNGAGEDATLKLLAETTTADIGINNVNGKVVTINLNGKTLTGSSTAAIIADTEIVIAGAGTVNKGELDNAVLSYGGEITINASATFIGTVDPGADIADCQAKFDVASNSTAGKCDLNPPTGKKFVQNGEYFELAAAAAVAELPTGNFTITGITVDDKFAAGEEMTFAVSPTEGYNVKSVKVNNSVVENNSGYSYTVTAADVEAGLLTIAVETEAAVVYATSIALNTESTLSIKIDGEVTFVATVQPDNATVGVEWDVTGNEESIVSFDTATGVLKGLKAGSVTITAKALKDATTYVTASCTVTVEEDVKPVDPGTNITKPTDKSMEDFIKEVNQNKANYLKAPYGKTEEAYLNCFEAVASGDNAVKMELSETGKATVQAKANADVAAALTAEAGTFKLTNAIPGFYYSLSQGGSLTGMGYGEQINQQYDADFTLVKGTEAGFYQIVVTEAPIVLDK